MAMLVDNRFQVFISYSTKDLDFARATRKALEESGIRAYLAEDTLLVGENLGVVKTAIRSSDLLMVLWSPSARKSQWVQHEIGIALGCDRPVLPVITEKRTTPGGALGQVKWLDAVGDPARALVSIQQTIAAWKARVEAEREAAKAAPPTNMAMMGKAAGNQPMDAAMLTPKPHVNRSMMAQPVEWDENADLLERLLPAFASVAAPDQQDGWACLLVKRPDGSLAVGAGSL